MWDWIVQLGIYVILEGNKSKAKRNCSIKIKNFQGKQLTKKGLEVSDGLIAERRKMEEYKVNLGENLKRQEECRDHHTSPPPSATKNEEVVLTWVHDFVRGRLPVRWWRRKAVGHDKEGVRRLRSRRWRKGCRRRSEEQVAGWMKRKFI